MEARVRASGLTHVEFLYPFPDYKLPRVILSESGLSDSTFDAADLLAFAHARDYGLENSLRMFDEPLVFRELAKNGLLGAFSNSFLVIASVGERPDLARQVLARTFAVARIAEFATQTTFMRSGENITVLKEPLCDGTRERPIRHGEVLKNISFSASTRASCYFGTLGGPSAQW